MKIYTLKNHSFTDEADYSLLNHRLVQVLEQIEQNSRSFGLHFQRWHSRHKLFSFRLNREQRIHCCFQEVEGQRSLILLAYHQRHDDYMNSSWTNLQYFQRHLRDLSDADYELYEINTTPSPAPEPAQSLEPIELSPESFKTILSLEQEKALSTTLPVILRGEPGSGKTTVATQILKDNATDAQPDSLLYVCRSSHLAQEISYQLADQPAICVKTLADLQQDSNHFPHFLSFEQIHTWCQETVSSFKKQKKNLSSLTALELAKEFELIHSFNVALKDIESCYRFYQTLGARQALAKTPEEKAFVISTHQRFWMQHPQVVTPALLPLKNLNQGFTMIAVDESQDMVFGDLIKLFVLQPNLLTCYDPLQNIAYDVAHQTDRLELFRAFSKKVFRKDIELIDFSFSFRCPPAVTVLAETLKNLKKEAVSLVDGNTKGLDKTLASAFDDNAAPVCWLDPETDRFKDSFDRIKSAADYAVITHEDYLEEAKNLYPPELVFSSSEIKGLQFNHVIVYLPFGCPGDNLHDLYAQLNIMLRTKMAKADGLTEEQIAELLHPLIVNITRTSNSLWIVQPKSHRLRFLLNCLGHEEGLTHPIELTLNQATLEDWMTLCKQLLISGHDERARSVYKNYLAGKLDIALSFEEFKSETVKTARSSLLENRIAIEPFPTYVTSELEKTTPEELAQKSSDSPDSSKKIAEHTKVLKEKERKSKSPQPHIDEKTANTHDDINIQNFMNRMKAIKAGVERATADKFCKNINQEKKALLINRDEFQKLFLRKLIVNREKLKISHNIDNTNSIEIQNRSKIDLLIEHGKTLIKDSSKSMLPFLITFLDEEGASIEHIVEYLLLLEKKYRNIQIENISNTSHTVYLMTEIAHTLLIIYKMQLLRSPSDITALKTFLSFIENSSYLKTSLVGSVVSDMHIKTILENNIGRPEIKELIKEIALNFFQKQDKPLLLMTSQENINLIKSIDEFLKNDKISPIYKSAQEERAVEQRAAKTLPIQLFSLDENLLLPAYTENLSLELFFDLSRQEEILNRFRFFLALFKKKAITVFDRKLSHEQLISYFIGSSNDGGIEEDKISVLETLKTVANHIWTLHDPLLCRGFLDQLVTTLPLSIYPILSFMTILKNDNFASVRDSELQNAFVCCSYLMTPRMPINSLDLDEDAQSYCYMRFKDYYKQAKEQLHKQPKQAVLCNQPSPILLTNQPTSTEAPSKGKGRPSI